jgi:hypothetical protein
MVHILLTLERPKVMAPTNKTISKDKFDAQKPKRFFQSYASRFPFPEAWGWMQELVGVGDSRDQWKCVGGKGDTMLDSLEHSPQWLSKFFT